MLCLIGTTLLLGLSFGDGSSAVSAPAPTVIAAPTTVGEALMHSMSDFQGALLQVGDGSSVQIVEIVFGANSQWHLTAAYLKCIDDEGKVIEVDRRDTCKAVFPRLEDVHGFYLTFPGTDENLWVDEIQFGRLPSGHMTRLGVRAVNAGGRSVDLLAAPAQAIPACSCIWSHQCTQGTCTGTCGAPVACPCTKAGQACDGALVCSCPADGYCTAPKKCKPKLVQTPEGDHFQVAASAKCECQ